MLKSQERRLIKLVTRSNKVFGRLRIVGWDSHSTFDQEKRTSYSMFFGMITEVNKEKVFQLPQAIMKTLHIFVITKQSSKAFYWANKKSRMNSVPVTFKPPEKQGT